MHVRSARSPLVLLTLSILLLLPACMERERPARSPRKQRAARTETERTGGDPLKRGEYLVSVLACDDCHTPMIMGESGPEPDMSRRLAGHPESMIMPPAPKLQGPWMWAGAATNTAFAGPWGVSYSMNLTPDQNTGMGVWTEELFVKAMREGKHMGVSRPIMPPMPWPAYRHLTDRDLKAVFAYLRTVPAIQNRVPEYQPAPGAEQIPAEPVQAPASSSPQG
ncbi:MAG TPA: diheme cytochrome c-553 [Thermoanaerobaculia bacterium]|nr:diheme cytochrome c-553 [Thermoanaerobaculia bacterium]